jgi:hypothetical protein
MKEQKYTNEQEIIAREYFQVLTDMIRQIALGINKEEINKKKAKQKAKRYKEIPADALEQLEEKYQHLRLLPYRVNDVQDLFQINEGVLL